MRIPSIFLVLFFVAGCSDNDVPSGVLPPQKMQDLVWDMMLADELADHRLQADSTKKPLEQYTGEYSKVLHLHGLSKEQFQQSMQFYKSRPDLMKPIFDSLQRRSERAIAMPASNQ